MASFQETMEDRAEPGAGTADGQTTVEWKCEGRIVEWTVPPGATQATIEAWGASGGDTTNYDHKGGRGAPGTLLTTHLMDHQTPEEQPCY